MALPQRIPTNDSEEQRRRELEMAEKRRALLDSMKGEAQRRGGALTEDLVGVAETEAAELGVSKKAFDSVVEREGLLAQPAPAPAPAPAQAPAKERVDPFASERAAQKVMYNRQYGSGLDTQKAMQDPDYVLGSGSALQQAPRQIGTKSGAMRREARRLRKQGYTAQAGQLAGAAAQQKLLEGSAIRSEAARGVEMAQKMQAGEMALQQQELMNQQMGLSKKLLDKRSTELDKGGDAPLDVDGLRRDPRYDPRYRRFFNDDTPYFGGRNKYFDFQ